MRRSDLLRALQTEIQNHNLSTFMSEQHKIVETGCCGPLLDRLSGESKSGGEA